MHDVNGFTNVEPQIRLPQTPVLSIVITSYSAERLKDLAELLESIKNQTYPRIEVIYVVEKSIHLFNWIKSNVQKRNIPNVKILFNNGEPGLAQARNLGLKEAEGEILAFIDDDVLLPPNWAEEMIKTYELDDSIIGVTGSAEPLWEDKSMRWLSEELYWIIGCTAWRGLNNLNGIAGVRSAGGMNMSFRSEVFDLAGSFMTSTGFRNGRMPMGFIAEDLEFSIRVRKLGGCIVYNPKVKLYHRVHKYRFCWKYIADRAFWVGYSRSVLNRFYSEDLSMEFNLLQRMLKTSVSSVKKLLKNPSVSWRRLLAIFMVILFATLGYIYSLLHAHNCKLLLISR